MSSGLGNRVCISDSSFNISSVIFSQPKNLEIITFLLVAIKLRVLMLSYFLNYLIKTKIAVCFSYLLLEVPYLSN